MSCKKICFGAGLIGRLAMKEYGKDNIAYFVDNNSSIVGKKIDGIEIINVEKLEEVYQNEELIITTLYNREIIEQLESMGITDYSVYTQKDSRLYQTDEFILNPYENNGMFYDNSILLKKQRVEAINKEVEELFKVNGLFCEVEIETINKCNGSCSFCPVSRGNDIREPLKMSWDLYTNIIEQLAEINYAGYLALQSNNEPFLDETIIEKHEYARKKLPDAKMVLFTNGTLLDLSKFIKIVDLLDELIIDNYQQQLCLIRPVKKIYDYCLCHPELRKKVTIMLRKPDEVLSNRGGDAPNGMKDDVFPNARCTLPYKQLIIRPDGKVSLCCNDAYGRETLADLTKESILEAWNNEKFQMIRRRLYEGRKNLEHCSRCDVLRI